MTQVQQLPAGKGGHALCSPSSSDQWLVCPGSVAMQIDEPDDDNEAAQQGTLCHLVSESILRTGAPLPNVKVPEELLALSNTYVQWVHDIVKNWTLQGAHVTMMVEQKLPLQDVTSERGQSGTSDCVLLVEFPEYTILHVIDAKFGYREVDVTKTRQLRVYGIAAMRKYELMHVFREVHCTICQPRVKAAPETEVYTVDQLEQFATEVMAGGQLALQIVLDGKATALQHLNPDDDTCRYCRAQTKCPARTRQIHETVYGEFSDIEDPEALPMAEDTFDGSREDFDRLLGTFFIRVAAIEAWCTYIRAKVEQRLLAGLPVLGPDGKPAAKLVMGRAGNRKLRSESAALAVLTGNNVPRKDFMTEPTLLSVAQLEKSLKAKYPGAWEALQTLVFQEPGKPSVALASDPRPPYAGPQFDGEDYTATGLV